MTRRRRIHTPGGLYYIAIRTSPGNEIYGLSEDADRFTWHLARAIRETGGKAHAFCWMPTLALMAIQVKELPASHFIQRMTSRFARGENRRRGRRGPFFEGRHSEVLVQRGRYLLDVVRYIHRAPIRAMLVENVDDHAHSSHLAYVGDIRYPWLTTHVAFAMAKNRGIATVAAYRRWVSKADRPSFFVQMEHGPFFDPRVIGTETFVRRVTSSDRVKREVPLAKLVLQVCDELNIRFDELLSQSRRRRLVLARALVAWRATRCGTTTLSSVGQQIGRDPSTLWVGIERYRRLYPDLFGAAAGQVSPRPDGLEAELLKTIEKED